MAIETDTITLPAAWCSALVNDDRSGLAEPECAALDRVLASLNAQGFRIVDVARDENGECEGPRFTWSFDMYGGTARGGDVLDYVAYVVG